MHEKNECQHLCSPSVDLPQEYSVHTNPKFFNSVIGGLIVTTAAERFVAEFAANNTGESNVYAAY